MSSSTCRREPKPAAAKSLLMRCSPLSTDGDSVRGRFGLVIAIQSIHTRYQKQSRRIGCRQPDVFAPVQPLKDRLATSHDVATLAKAPRYASLESARRMIGTPLEERLHLEMGMSYLLAHKCKVAKIVDDGVVCQSKC